MPTSTSVNRGSPSRRGNAIVEFAVSFPLLLTMTLGVFQFGYGFFAYNTLRNSVQAAARYAAQADYVVGSSSYETAVKNMAVYGHPSPDGTPQAALPGLTTAQITVATTEVDGIGVPRGVTVSVTGYEIPILWDSLPLNNKPQSSFAYMGQFVDN